MGQFQKQVENKNKLDFFFPFHHNLFNYLLPNNILAFLHIQLFINHVLNSFLKIEIPHYYTHKCNYGLPSTNMFPKIFQLEDHKLLLSFHDIANFAFYMHYLSINTHNNFCPRTLCRPSILESSIQFIDFFPFLALVKFSFAWVISIITSSLVLVLATLDGSIRT